ncbi:hypothetical protein OJAV_G00236500 [Oryzias javanicus]|uniref:Uncharacterized protein n=1 Tax=Oryzias javanicus TaxID=123683 RepID=A0A3S2MBG2_ORYJA|nr:hypothetical protein OJAV_G00236500 [Oryzias javanicus]
MLLGGQSQWFRADETEVLRRRGLAAGGSAIGAARSTQNNNVPVHGFPGQQHFCNLLDIVRKKGGSCREKIQHTLKALDQEATQPHVGQFQGILRRMMFAVVSHQEDQETFCTR